MEDDEQEPAIVIRNVYKRYGDTIVLNGLSMTVRQGTIYSLLGPSGGGKTSLLRVIVGIATIDDGHISVNATKRSQIGYMPQNLGLHDQLSISENCYFYGYLHGMSTTKIRARIKELLTLLQLPHGSRLVRNLSGGEQKRVSMLITFIHDPKILILDEPTVGLDMLLVERLWQWFFQLVVEGKTILITTHSMVEANHANKIAFMRNGVLLTEKAPDEVMKEHACNNLEDAFLKLSYEQECQIRSLPRVEYPQEIKPVTVHYRDDVMLSIYKLFALFFKNLVLFRRDTLLSSFILLLPGLTMFLGIETIGGNLKNLKIAIFNEEIDLAVCRSYNNTNSCFSDSDNVYLSCLFLQFLNKKSFVLVEYSDMKTGEIDVQKSKVSALLHFPRNYTASIIERLENGREVDEETLDRTFIEVYIDYSNPFAENYIKFDLMKTLNDYLKQMLTACDINPKVVLIPLTFEKPIFGKEDDDFLSYGINGMMVLCAFFFPGFMALVSIFTEKTGDITERIMVTGISRSLIMIALFCFLTLLFSVELAEILGVAYFMLDRPLKGIFWSVVSLLVLNGISGLFFGFVLAVVYDDLMIATYTGCGALMSLAFLTGLMWPIEGQHSLLRSINWLFPVVKPVTSLRDINSRGYSFTSFSVITGYLSSLQWILIFFVIIYFCLKKQ